MIMNEKAKAKRYDEAIKIAKSKIENNKDHVLYEDDVIEMFPELRESEDEEIRKAMIDFFKSERQEGITVLHYGVNIERMIAWLEKKGEQKEIDYNEELRKCKANPLYFFDKYVKVKLKEQKSSWGEEDERIIEDASKYLREYASQVQGVYSKRYVESIADRIESLRPQNTWKPSDEQMDALYSAIRNPYLSTEYNGITALLKQLKKLKEE